MRGGEVVSRAAVNDDWSVEWERDDSIWVWGYYPNEGIGTSTKFAMDDFDEDESTFTGSIDGGYDMYRILYACGDDTDNCGNKLYKIDLTEQDAIKSTKSEFLNQIGVSLPDTITIKDIDPKPIINNIYNNTPQNNAQK